MKYVRTIVCAASVVLSGMSVQMFADENLQADEDLPAEDTVTNRHDKSFYIPEVHGVARARYEIDVDNGEGRFQVRNARVNLSGHIMPRLRYYLNTDFCDKGSVKVLDVWARVDIGRRWFVQAGQFRIPFGTDNFRGPGTYLFANRSYLGKYVNNVRAVGIKGHYTLPWGKGNYIEAGMFNSATISDHDVWSKDYAYAVKVSQQATPWLRFETGFESIEPSHVRMNLWGASAIVSFGEFHAEAEYMRTVYTNDMHPSSNVYNIFADWGLPVKVGIFDRWSIQGRLDAISSHSDGKEINEQGFLTTTMTSQQRMTLGSALSYTFGKVHALVRLNYEKVFGGDDFDSDDIHGNRFVAELVVQF